MKNLNKFFLTASLILILFITVNGVCATDLTNNNNTVSINDSNNILSGSVSNNDSVSLNDHNVQLTENKNINNVSTVDELKSNDLNSNDGSSSLNTVKTYASSNFNTISVPNGKVYLTSTSSYYSSFSDALMYASNYDTMIIGSGTYNSLGNVGYQFSANLTIKADTGANVIFDGENDVPYIFKFWDGSNINISGITFKNANQSFINYENLNINNCTFINFKNNGTGGAIYSLGSLIVNNSIFKNNYAESGGAAICNSGTLIVNNSNFENNNGTYDGTIYASGNASILNSIFLNEYNNAISFSTGIYDINNLVFLNCSIHSLGTLTIKNSNFTKGRINNQGNLTIINSNFVNATSTSGGAIDNSFRVNVTNTTFINNYATKLGGAIYNYCGNVTAKGCTFINNTAGIAGGAIFTTRELGRNVNVNVTYSIFLNNNATTIFTQNNPQSTSALYNWWGNNENPKTIVSSDVDISNWVIMNLTLSQNSIGVGETSTLTATLNQYYLSSYYISRDLEEALPSRTVIFTSTSGSLNPISSAIVGSLNSVYTAPLSKGTYYLYATIDNQQLYLPIVVGSGSSKIGTVISGSDFTESYGDGLFYNSTLKDKNGNILAGKIAKLTLTKPSTGASKTYWATSDSEGKFSLQINLASGYYTITTTYDGDSEYESSSYTNTITVNPQTKTSTSLTAYDFSESYGAAQNFTATLRDNNGNPIIGQHITLLLIKTSNKATKTYYTSTDVKGNAYLEINLASGNYLIVCSYDGNSQYVSSTGTATITVTS